jgi:hypothetical protein
MARLTTRWSGPGQGGAIIRRSLGRAAQLETVGRIVNTCQRRNLWTS